MPFFSPNTILIPQKKKR